jgi:SP family general alpha glucoside:H+ symporter-like MFS transporter
LQYLFAGLFLVFCYWLPESPVFHIHHKRLEKAENVIRQLYGPDYDTKRHIEFLLRTAEAECQTNQASKGISYRELFKGQNRTRLMISACIIWPLFMGTAFWPNYQTYYFEAAGAANPQAMNYGATSVAIGTSIIAWFLIERVGRRKLWLLGACGMSLSNLIGGLMWIPYSRGNKGIAGRVATAMVFIWNGFYDIGPANMGYAITSEVPSSRMRIRSNAFIHVFSHLSNLAVSYIVPYLYNSDTHSAGLGLRMGFIWGAFGFVFVVWGFFFIPNLAGFNAYEIDQLFESKTAPRRFHRARFDENDILIRSSLFRNPNGQESGTVPAS